MSSVESFLEEDEDGDEPPPPNRGRQLAVIVGVVSFVVWIVVGVVIGRTESAISPRPAATATVTVRVTTTATAKVTVAGVPAVTGTIVPTVPAGVGGNELLRFSGAGSRTSEAFAVTGGSFTLAWAYDCSAYGSIGAFQVNLQRGTVQVDLLANQLGRGGSGFTRATDDPGTYQLLVNSECVWSVQVLQ